MMDKDIECERRLATLQRDVVNYYVTSGYELTTLFTSLIRRLSPLRIKYHQGKVLDIVESTSVQDTDGLDEEASTQDTASNKDPTLGDVGSGAQSSLYTQIKDQESILENMVPKRERQRTLALSFRDTLADLQKAAKLVTSEDKAIQNDFTNITVLARDLDLTPLGGHQKTPTYLRLQAEKVSSGQERILEAQQKRIDDLVSFQDSVEKLATLAFGVQDRPVPRLFIVLPKKSALSKDQEHLSYGDFQLYFLCECHRENADQEGGSFGNIHLTTHYGYELEKAEEFFEDYGSYIQAILYILTNGITAPGIHVPSMAHLKLTEGVDNFQDYLRTSTIEFLIQMTMTFMERIQSRKETIDQESVLDLLEHTDLQPLVQYLKNVSSCSNVKDRAHCK
jgi:hypothetical protein